MAPRKTVSKKVPVKPKPVEEILPVEVDPEPEPEHRPWIGGGFS